MVHLLVHHKWFIRAGLAVFWATEIIAYAFGYGFITFLLEKHTWWSLIILFLTFKYLLEPFYAPFCTIKSTGGDAVMEKSTKIMLVLVAALASVLTVMFVSPGARQAIINGFNNTIFQPVMGLWLGFVNWLDGVRGIYLVGATMVATFILAIFINHVALPKIQTKRQKTEKPYMGGPEYVPPTVLPQKQTSATPKTVETSTPNPAPSTVKEEAS